MGSVNKVKPNSPRQLSRKNTSKSSPNNFRHPNDVSAPPQTPAGQWIEANESMSPSSRAYQKFITGTDKVFSRYGVKFDGAEGDTLIEAKGSYSSFVNSSTGRFFGWFKGSKGLVDQANRQIVAADGAPIKWYFADQKSLNATQTLFKQNGVNGITLEYKPMK